MSDVILVSAFSDYRTPEEREVIRVEMYNDFVAQNHVLINRMKDSGWMELDSIQSTHPYKDFLVAYPNYYPSPCSDGDDLLLKMIVHKNHEGEIINDESYEVKNIILWRLMP